MVKNKNKNLETLELFCYKKAKNYVWRKLKNEDFFEKLF
jgi:hypothetical protein